MSHLMHGAGRTPGWETSRIHIPDRAMHLMDGAMIGHDGGERGLMPRTEPPTLVPPVEHQLVHELLPTVAPPPIPPARAEAGLLPGELVAAKWRLIQRIGRGAFGDIFIGEGQDETHWKKRYAMKLEKLPAPIETTFSGTPEEQEAERRNAQAAAAARAVLKLEAVILSKLQRYPFVGRFIEYGRDLNHNVAYLLMSLLGENLLRLRRRRKDGKFTMGTILRFGIQAIRCIQAVHEVGFLHRDIKPSNFVIGSNKGTIHGNMLNPPQQQPHRVHSPTSPSLDSSLNSSSDGGSLKTDPEPDPFSPSRIFIIDFGLARCYRDRATGTVIPSRGHIKGFRGTPRYASIHVHREEDLGRRDDLWSLFYILVEFATGDLPWGQKRDKDEIGRVKEQYMNLKLLKIGQPGEIPSCFVPFMKHLYALKFESRPNYDYLVSLLQGKLRRLGYGWCDGDGSSDLQSLPGGGGLEHHFDWEDWETRSTVGEDLSLQIQDRHHLPNVQEQPSPQHRVPSPVHQQEHVNGLLQAATTTVPQLSVEAPVFPHVVPLHASGNFSPSIEARESPPLPLQAFSSEQQQQQTSTQTPQALYPSSTTTGATIPSPTRELHRLAPQPSNDEPQPSASSTTSLSSASIAPPFSGLPLSQPIPVPDTVILSPRKRESAQAAALAAVSKAKRESRRTLSGTSSGLGSFAASTSASASRPPRHSSATSLTHFPSAAAIASATIAGTATADANLKISLDSQRSSTGRVSPPINSSPLRSPSPSPSPDGELLEDLRADLNKQRSVLVRDGSIGGTSMLGGFGVTGAGGQNPSPTGDAMYPDWASMPTPRGTVPSSSPPPPPVLSTASSMQAMEPLSSPPFAASQPFSSSGAFTARLHAGLPPQGRSCVSTATNTQDRSESHDPFYTKDSARGEVARQAQNDPDQTDGFEGEGIFGDGRTIMPGAAVGAHPNGEQPAGANPQHSLNDAYVLSQNVPDASLAPDRMATGGAGENLDFVLAPMDGSPGWLPLNSPMATPLQLSSMGRSDLLGDEGIGLDASRLGLGTKVPRQLQLGGIDTHSQPQQQPTANGPVASTGPIPFVLDANSASNSRRNSAIAAGSSSSPVLASVAPSGGALSSLPPSPSRPLRPMPPGAPPPAYSNVQRSFGRFKSRLERSPSKPLSRQQVEELDLTAHANQLASINITHEEQDEQNGDSKQQEQ